MLNVVAQVMSIASMLSRPKQQLQLPLQDFSTVLGMSAEYVNKHSHRWCFIMVSVEQSVHQTLLMSVLKMATLYGEWKVNQAL